MRTVILLLSGLLLASPGWCADELTGLSDEFSSAEALSNWQRLHQVDRQPATYVKLDVGETQAGWLSMIPRPGAWYRDGRGPFLFKTITGNFIATTMVVARNRNQPSQPPNASFNAGGILARDPASQRGRENWVVVNVGRENGRLGTEVKTTVNSNSQLWTRDGVATGEVRMVRLGAQFHLLKRLQGEQQWTELTTFNRPDLPETLQVGLMCNGWTNNPDLLVFFDYIRFDRPENEQDLTRDLPAQEG